MALSKDRQRARWQRAARLFLEEAHAHDLSRQVELAMFYDRQLDLRSSACCQERVPQCMREKRLTVDELRAVSAANSRVSPAARSMGLWPLLPLTSGHSQRQQGDNTRMDREGSYQLGSMRMSWHSELDIRCTATGSDRG